MKVEVRRYRKDDGWSRSQGNFEGDLGPYLGFLSVALSNNGRWLAVGGGLGIHVLDLESMKMTILQGHSQSAISLRFASDDRTLISTTGSKLMFWQVETWQELMTYRDNTPPRVGFMPRVEVSPDGRYLIRVGTLSGESGPSVRVWQTPSFEEIESSEDKLR